jgi:cell shape-determining protein MreD
MIIKYISFLIGIIWSYSIIKTQSVFSKKAGIVFKIFITKISWFTLIAACYFGYKNFSIKSTVIGVIIGVLLVNLGFYLLKRYINQKFSEKKCNNLQKFF